MKLNHKLKLSLRAQNIVFVVLLLAITGAAAYLTTRYDWQADWTVGGRNSLTDASRKLLRSMDGPIEITAFARDEKALRDAIRDLVGKYQRVDSEVHLKFVNPDTQPERVRKLGITTDGELYIAYQGRSEKVQQPTEQNLTNALQRIARASASRAVFLTGHGERSPNGQANFDLSTFAQSLKDKGFKISTLKLSSNPHIPSDTTLLVIASPQTDLLPGEVKLIRDYVARGGNLLWLHDPGSLHGLAPLAKTLGISFDDGTIVDATSPLFGVNDVRWLVLDDYPPSDITRQFSLETLFPGATAIKLGSDDKWRGDAFLKSRPLPRSWLETGKLAGEVRYDKGTDQPGPLDIGVTLARPLAALAKASSKPRPPVPSPQSRAEPAKAATASTPTSTASDADPSNKGDQRVIVIGDGDFLANAFVGNGGNLDLGLNIFNWLSGNDSFIDVNVPRAPDLHLTLSRGGQELLGGGFLILLPLLLLIYGGTIWFRRRRR